jgi:ABC-2 type transport system ATP-binding protein
VIRVDHLTKRYNGIVAVDDISFQVEQGEILGFLGPNGAGKTTTMKIITCYMPPTSGEVVFDGKSIATDSMAIRSRLGYLPEHTPLYGFLPVQEYLAFVADMREMTGPLRRRRIDEMIEVCGLGEVLGQDIRTLSKGYRQRVGLAQALIHDPDLIILDEPTAGLDPNQIVEIRSLIRQIGQQKTLILSTHILPEVTATCDRIIIINRGRLVADGRPEQLAGSLKGHQWLRVGFAREDFKREQAGEALARIPGVSRVEDGIFEGALVVFRLEVEKESDPRVSIFRLAAEQQWPLAELHLERESLEEVFRELTVGAEASIPAA